MPRYQTYCCKAAKRRYVPTADIFVTNHDPKGGLEARCYSLNARQPQILELTWRPWPLDCGVLSMTDDQKAALEVARYELNYRREKQWKIFAWIATILLAVIGGIVAGKQHWQFDVYRKLIMTAALTVVTIYACTWIRENIRFEELAGKKIAAYLKDETILAQPGRFKLGYNGTILLLLLGALGAILIS
jgi:hypothetical protein